MGSTAADHSNALQTQLLPALLFYTPGAGGAALLSYSFSLLTENSFRSDADHVFILSCLHCAAVGHAQPCPTHHCSWCSKTSCERPSVVLVLGMQNTTAWVEPKPPFPLPALALAFILAFKNLSPLGFIYRRAVELKKTQKTSHFLTGLLTE